LDDIDNYKYDGINSIMPGKTDYRLPVLPVYNGPIDPKDADNYLDYHNTVDQS
jgi:hypothetical protein